MTKETINYLLDRSYIYYIPWFEISADSDMHRL